MPVGSPYLRDGIDVYVRGEDEVHFVFLATRARIVLKAKPYLIFGLAWLDGASSGDVLVGRMSDMHGLRAGAEFRSFLSYLEEKGIVVAPDWLEASCLDGATIATQRRQLHFLLDVLGTPHRAVTVQQRIFNALIVCFGVGAVGSWLVRQLLGLGFRRFVLVDHDTTSPTDVARHAFFDATLAAGTNKAEATAARIHEQFPGVEVTVRSCALTTQTILEDVIPRETSLVINAADQPYIGYTSVLLSRYCVPRRLPLLVAGGFDAHLGSVGEMIIPGITPCADCYADYFANSLKDWVPVEHPVTDRHDATGGLCATSVFAAGSAAMQVLRLFTEVGAPVGGRGELLFDKYELETFQVSRNPSCLVCSGL